MEILPKAIHALSEHHLLSAPIVDGTGPAGKGGQGVVGRVKRSGLG